MELLALNTVTKKVRMNILIYLQYFTAGGYSTIIISSIRQACCAPDTCKVDYCANTEKVLQYVCESIVGGEITLTACVFVIYDCHLSVIS